MNVKKGNSEKKIPSVKIEKEGESEGSSIMEQSKLILHSFFCFFFHSIFDWFSSVCHVDTAIFVVLLDH